MEQMLECIHLLPEGVIQEENIMKLLSKAGGPGTSNVCHPALLVFLNDSQEMKRAAAFMAKKISILLF